MCCKALGKRLFGNVKTQDSSWVHSYVRSFAWQYSLCPVLGTRPVMNQSGAFLAPWSSQPVTSRDKQSGQVRPAPVPHPRLMTSPSSGFKRPVVYLCLHRVHLPTGLSPSKVGLSRIHFASDQGLWSHIDLGLNPGLDPGLGWAGGPLPFLQGRGLC